MSHDQEADVAGESVSCMRKGGDGGKRVHGLKSDSRTRVTRTVTSCALLVGYQNISRSML